MKYKKIILFFSLLIITSRAWSTDLSLNDYLKDVSEQNLVLKSQKASLDASQARAIGVHIPPPMVAVTQMRDQSGTANNFEVSQTIPFPTKLSNDHSAREFEAKAENASFSVMKNETLAKARLIYITTWLTQEKIKFLNEQKDIIQQHIKLVTASARSDSSLRIHLLKAESDSDLLDNEILETEQTVREKQIQLAEFAGKNPMTYQPSLLEPPLSKIPTASEMSQPMQLEVKRFNFEKLKARESEASSLWLPDISLRYREMGGGTTMMSKFNEVMVGVSLPFIFFWEPHAATQSAAAERYQGEVELSQAQLKIDSRKASLLAKAESLKKELAQIKEKLLPRAEKRMHLLNNIAPRDMESLKEHREAMEDFPILKLKALDLREQFEAAIAELSSFTSGVSP
jgi:outer membrane protein TolC